jgi:hypothetical protein
MKVSITSIKLNSIWKLPSLAMYVMKIKRQSKKAGALEVASKGGFGTIHYTMSLWPNEESIESFSKSDAHLEALKKSRQLAEEIQVLTMDGKALPALEEAKVLLEKEGRTIRY